MKTVSALILLASLAAVAPALAQAPAAPAPAGPPRTPPPPVGGPTLALAIEAAETAISACQANGYKVGATVVDETGALKVSLTADGASAIGGNGGRRKAILAAVMKDTSAAVQEKMKTDKELETKVNANTADWLPRPGAYLIKVGDRIVGALGVGGAPGGDKDEACAQAGINKIQARLK